MRKARSYQERCEGALAYARAELNRIKVAHRAALQEFRELGNNLSPGFGFIPKDYGATVASKGKTK